MYVSLLEMRSYIDKENLGSLNDAAGKSGWRTKLERFLEKVSLSVNSVLSLFFVRKPKSFQHCFFKHQTVFIWFLKYCFLAYSYKEFLT